MNAYSELYLPRAMKNLGEAMDYAVNACGVRGELFMERFLVSGLAAEWEAGSPRVLSGLSGTELVREAFRQTGTDRDWPPPQRAFELTPSYWSGWILAYYQWRTARSFRGILEIVSLEEIVGRYHPLHEEAESQFVDWVESLVDDRARESPIRRARHLRGWTQQEVASRAGVTLRSLRNYEQHPNSFARAEYAAAKRILGCLAVYGRCVLAVVLLASAAASACVETTPAPRLNLNSDVRGTNWWVRLHNDRLANVCRQGGEVDVVLLGDSITHYWDHKPYAYETWNEFTNAYKVLNFGYAGDRTQNLLWRVRNGELDGYRAKSVVLTIGTNNNTDSTTNPTNVATGVKAVLDEIAVRQPRAKVLLLPIFPRGFGADDVHHAAARRRNDETNKLIREFADGERVRWLDFTDQYLDPATGWTTKVLFPDRIHPGALGCRIWLEAMKPHLDAFCGRTDPIVAQTLPNLSLEGRDFSFGVIAYTPDWSALPLRDHFRMTGGWTRLADGRVRGDIRLACVKPCELGVLALSGGFPLDPVSGRMWMADGVARTLPAKRGKDIHLGSGQAHTFLFPLPDGRTLRAEFDEPVPYRAQDLRAWGPNWGVRLGGCQARRSYAVGDTVAFTVVLSAAEGLRIRRETTSK